MLERDLLLNATAAILVACLAWQFAAPRRRFGRAGFVLVVAGTLLPLADAAVLHLVTADRIELLSRGPYVAAPLHALALLAAVALLTGFALGPALAMKLSLGLAAGFALHVLLSVLTPVGWPLLAPFSQARVALPVLPEGHGPLLALLLAAVALAEFLPGRRVWLAPAAAAVVALYAIAGAVQYTVLATRVQHLAGAAGHVHVYPDDAWLASWQVVVEAPDRYELRRQHAFAPAAQEAKIMARWNDEPLFLKLLGDPVVNRFYFQVFHHPVVRLELTGSQITLLMQEMRDQSPLVPGPTFYLESDLTGRNRFYQLQRFN